MQCPNFVLHVSIHPPKFERKKEKNNQDMQEFDEVRKQEDGYDKYSRCTWETWAKGRPLSLSNIIIFLVGPLSLSNIIQNAFGLIFSTACALGVVTV